MIRDSNMVKAVFDKIRTFKKKDQLVIENKRYADVRMMLDVDGDKREKEVFVTVLFPVMKYTLDDESS